MKAVCYFGPGQMRCDTVPDARLQDVNDIVVRMEKCGICGSDLHIYHGLVVSDSLTSVGHEAVGEVVDVGRGVKRFKSGDKVMLSALVGCGECAACQSGRGLRCVARKVRAYGWGLGLDGCQAEAIRVPSADFSAAIIPEGITIDQALLLTDNLPTAYAACRTADIRPGSTVAIIGLGPIGLMAVEIAFVLGADRVFAVDLVKERRELAATLGAICLTPDVAADVISDLTSGSMAGSVIEAVGSDRTVALALQSVAAMGSVSVLGVGIDLNVCFPPKAIEFGVTFRLIRTEIMRHWAGLIPLILERRIKPERFLTDELALSDAAQAYARFDLKLDGTLKVVMTP